MRRIFQTWPSANSLPYGMLTCKPFSVHTVITCIASRGCDCEVCLGRPLLPRVVTPYVTVEATTMSAMDPTHKTGSTLATSCDDRDREFVPFVPRSNTLVGLRYPFAS